MFIHRLTWNVKGDLNDAAALATDYWKQVAPPHRILTSWLYPNDVLVVELEFASLGEYEEFWRGHHATGSERAAWHSENGERMEAAFGPEQETSQEMWEVR